MDSPEPAAPPKNHRARGRLIAVAVVVAALVAGFFYWLNARHYVSDDDAQIDGDIVNLSPRISGTLLAVHVQENQVVKAGDPIAEIDPRDYQVAYQAAEAALTQAKANQAEAEENRARALALTRAGAMTKSERDRLVSTADVDAAQVKLAEAQLEQARLNLSYTKIVAPVDGIIGKKAIAPGDHVSPGQEMVAISQVDHLWVTANFRENKLRRIHPGQRVHVHVDALGKTFTGVVTSIGGATGASFSVLPPENATGNYVKVVQRIPVRIDFDPGQAGLDRLRPGMSVEPKVKLG
ncbi:MAG: HlyD family secretion protein [Deltaproteobacteria bacterium]|nr:HlyD family secretion protein [Deltaproteobacteria bacterium]